MPLWAVNKRDVGAAESMLRRLIPDCADMFQFKKVNSKEDFFRIESSADSKILISGICKFNGCRAELLFEVLLSDYCILVCRPICRNAGGFTSNTFSGGSESKGREAFLFELLYFWL